VEGAVYLPGRRSGVAVPVLIRQPVSFVAH